MFVFISHLSVPEDGWERLEEHFRNRGHLVDQFPGFLYLQILRPEGGNATHSFITAWEDRASFQRYMKSREHAESKSREPADVMARSTVRHEAYQVLLDSRQQPEWLAVSPPSEK